MLTYVAAGHGSQSALWYISMPDSRDKAWSPINERVIAGYPSYIPQTDGSYLQFPCRGVAITDLIHSWWLAQYVASRRISGQHCCNWQWRNKKLTS